MKNSYKAVRQFMSSISSNEEVSLLGFSSGVEFDSGFTSDSAELEPYIEMLNPGGGTDIAMLPIIVLISC